MSDERAITLVTEESEVHEGAPVCLYCTLYPVAFTIASHLRLTEVAELSVTYIPVGTLQGGASVLKVEEAEKEERFEFPQLV